MQGMVYIVLSMSKGAGHGFNVWGYSWTIASIDQFSGHPMVYILVWLFFFFQGLKI